MKIEYIVWDSKNKVMYNELAGMALAPNGKITFIEPSGDYAFQEDYIPYLYTGKDDVDGEKIYDGNLLVRPKYKLTDVYEVFWNALQNAWGLMATFNGETKIYDYAGVGENTSDVTEWKKIGHNTDGA